MKIPDISTNKDVRDLVNRALAEDLGVGDITSIALVKKNAASTAAIISRGNYIVSGTSVAACVFRSVDRSLKVTVAKADGQRIMPGRVIMKVAGSVRAILTAERTALNFLQRMTGIATLTSIFVQKSKQYGVTILDTRKTTPTLRSLEKYAVLCGGGSNHRIGLFDKILIKDNHRRSWTETASKGMGDAVLEARRKYPGVEIEIEVESLSDLRSVLDAKPDWVLLDNMNPSRLKQCVKACDGRVRLEASGGITLKNIEAVASTGVNAISLGCLTHSAPAADLSLELK